MNKKRKQVEKIILDFMKELTGTEFNVKLYKDMFDKMSDKEFDKFMEKLKNGMILQVIVPPDKDAIPVNIKVEKNLKLAKKWFNYDFFQKITIGPTSTLPKYTTKEKFLIMDLPFRRTKQTIEKGLTVSLNAKKIDMLTGQPKDESTANKLSFPELQMLVGMGMNESIIELVRDRGGDIAAMRVLLTGLTKTGTITQELVSKYAQGVLSTKTLKAYLNGMHLKNTLP